MAELKFHIKLPIFVARQWIRHRTANVNEISGRYSKLENEFWIPREDDFRKQHRVNKQMSSDEILNMTNEQPVLVDVRGIFSTDESFVNKFHYMKL